MVNVQKNDFIELEFSGYANGELFDSNKAEDLKKLHDKAKAEPLIICLGHGMVVRGLDAALAGKEIGKEYTINVASKEAFGARKKEWVRTVPMKVFLAQRIMPEAGMTLMLDQNVVKIIAVSGARVLVDFNNPLSGKDLEYHVKILRKIESTEEKAKSFFAFFFRFAPDFEVKDTIIVKGPKVLEQFVKAFSKKAEELVGKPLSFELKEEPKQATASQSAPEATQQSL